MALATTPGDVAERLLLDLVDRAFGEIASGELRRAGRGAEEVPRGPPRHEYGSSGVSKARAGSDRSSTFSSTGAVPGSSSGEGVAGDGTSSSSDAGDEAEPSKMGAPVGRAGTVALSKIVRIPGYDVFGRSMSTMAEIVSRKIACPVCTQPTLPNRLTKHMEKCMGLGGRTASRTASKRIQLQQTYSGDRQESESSDEFASAAERQASEGAFVNIDDSGSDADVRAELEAIAESGFPLALTPYLQRGSDAKIGSLSPAMSCVASANFFPGTVSSAVLPRSIRETGLLAHPPEAFVRIPEALEDKFIFPVAHGQISEAGPPSSVEVEMRLAQDPALLQPRAAETLATVDVPVRRRRKRDESSSSKKSKHSRRASKKHKNKPSAAAVNSVTNASPGSSDQLSPFFTDDPQTDLQHRLQAMQSHSGAHIVAGQAPPSHVTQTVSSPLKQRKPRKSHDEKPSSTDAHKLKKRLKSLMGVACGTVSGVTGRCCSKSLNCPQHSDEDRLNVREKLLGQTNLSIDTLHERCKRRWDRLMKSATSKYFHRRKTGESVEPNPPKKNEVLQELSLDRPTLAWYIRSLGMEPEDLMHGLEARSPGAAVGQVQQVAEFPDHRVGAADDPANLVAAPISDPSHGFQLDFDPYTYGQAEFQQAYGVGVPQSYAPTHQFYDAFTDPMGAQPELVPAAMAHAHMMAHDPQYAMQFGGMYGRVDESLYRPHDPMDALAGALDVPDGTLPDFSGQQQAGWGN